MILNSDIHLHHPLWERAEAELCRKDALGIFNRLVDVYILACAIGISEDKIVVDTEELQEQYKTIGRNTHRENADVRDVIEFMLQNAIINTQTIALDEDERIRLAFDPDYNVKSITPQYFLTGFANYGIEKIFEHIDTKSSLVAISELYAYMETLNRPVYDDILATIVFDEISNN